MPTNNIIFLPFGPRERPQGEPELQDSFIWTWRPRVWEMLLFETDARIHKYRAGLSHIIGFLCGPSAGFRELLGTFSWSGWAISLLPKLKQLNTCLTRLGHHLRPANKPRLELDGWVFSAEALLNELAWRPRVWEMLLFKTNNYRAGLKYKGDLNKLVF